MTRFVAPQIPCSAHIHVRGGTRAFPRRSVELGDVFKRHSLARLFREAEHYTSNAAYP